MRRTIFLTLAGLLGIAGIQAVAQSVDGLDLDAVKRRAAAMEGDADLFAAQVKRRSDALREEAQTTADGGTANLRRIATAELPHGPAGAVDFDEIVRGAGGSMAGARGDAPQFIVFASLSMPEVALRRLIADTATAGGVVVFRGFPNNSLKDFGAMLGKVVAREEQAANIGIDPRLFRAFNVQAVPTFVSVASDFDLCAGLNCKSEVPPHDRMAGNVTVAYALETFARANGPGARVAGVALGNLAKAAR